MHKHILATAIALGLVGAPVSNAGFFDNVFDIPICCRPIDDDCRRVECPRVEPKLPPKQECRDACPTPQDDIEEHIERMRRQMEKLFPF